MRGFRTAVDGLWKKWQRSSMLAFAPGAVL
jgi:hypothetical protein